MHREEHRPCSTQRQSTAQTHSPAPREHHTIPGIGALGATARCHWKRSAIPESPRSGRLARPRAARILDWRKAEASRYQQARKPIRAQIARTWSTILLEIEPAVLAISTTDATLQLSMVRMLKVSLPNCNHLRDVIGVIEVQEASNLGSAQPVARHNPASFC